jgi:16S rRNA (guanine(966)-N(2))-methyltransferase RsmD
MAGLRVIGGVSRGRKLRSVPGSSTRPITDRTKESLFNIIGADIIGAFFLDLFGGTGSVGIEALSRGAEQAVFFDLDHRAIETIHANLATTGFQDRAIVKRGDALKFLTDSPIGIFDYIYIAPPQYKSLWKQALKLIDKNPAWMSLDAWVIVQIHPKEFEEFDLKNLKELDQRQYGSTLLVFYATGG